ncbi:hypothetical protein Droror1_Dr00014223 [Drosera rotundifolia]
MTDEATKGGVIVSKSVLKKQKRTEEWEETKKKEIDEKRVKNAKNRKLIFSWAKIYAKEYDEQEKELVRLKREMKFKRGFYVELEARLLLQEAWNQLDAEFFSTYFNGAPVVRIPELAYDYGYALNSMTLTAKSKCFHVSAVQQGVASVSIDKAFDRGHRQALSVTAVDSGRGALQFLGLYDEEERSSTTDVSVWDLCFRFLIL